MINYIIKYYFNSDCPEKSLLSFSEECFMLFFWQENNRGVLANQKT